LKPGHVVCGVMIVHPRTERNAMDEPRRNQATDSMNREASNTQDDQQDDLSRRRELQAKRPPLTQREQQERWPIG
jgi:hypothetical protein